MENYFKNTWVDTQAGSVTTGAPPSSVAALRSNVYLLHRSSPSHLLLSPAAHQI